MGLPELPSGRLNPDVTANTLRYLIRVENKRPKGEIILFESFNWEIVENS